MANIVIGVTGLIASGKSTLCKAIRDTYDNVHIFDCDKHVSLMYEDNTFIHRLKVEYGISSKEEMLECILDENCNADLTDVGNFFLIHGLSEAIDEFINSHSGVIVLDAPLLFESSLGKDFCDYTVSVIANQEKRRGYYAGRNECLASRKEVPIELFDVSRVSQETMAMLSDHCVNNDYDAPMDISFMTGIMHQFLYTSKTAIYAGSFDPLTSGHLDIIHRASGLFDNVIVAVSNNLNKKHVFSSRDRIAFLKRYGYFKDNVFIVHAESSTIKTAESFGARYIVRGIRNAVDYEYEKQLNQINASLSDMLESVYLFANAKSEIVSSSSLMKIGNSIDWDIDLLSDYAPKYVLQALAAKFKRI